MTAWQRSRITERSEKGLGPISFKRLLLAGGAGGIVAMVGGRVIGFVPSCLSAALVLGLVLGVTHPVEGRPLFAFALRSLRGLATVAAVHRREGSLSLAGRLMKVTPEEGILHAAAVYDAEWEDEEQDDLLDAGWEYLGGFADAGREGLSAAEDPFKKGAA
jgi:hypothetical protein